MLWRRRAVAFSVSNNAAAAAAAALVLLAFALCAAFTQRVAASWAGLAFRSAPAVLIVVYGARDALGHSVLWLERPGRALVACLLPSQFLEVPGSTLCAATVRPLLGLVRAGLAQYACRRVVVHVRSHGTRNTFFFCV